ncbi:restriction endonuclease [Mesorhizobium sp. M0006]|uniref:restriction endonuclease n=1 Tax=Mesorhizobium sp. M0006 TaxID=2956838 RepID=UPI003339A85F
MSRTPFSNLRGADLVVDAIYESDRNSTTVGSEPLASLTGTGNQGGFRFSGSVAAPELVVLYTTMAEADWPDSMDEENGLFYYYGDNRRPGFELHDRRAGRGGNRILRSVFEDAHGTHLERAKVPPFLIFSKGENRRDAVFRGLAVPGAEHLDAGSDLVAIWKSIEGQRFQNYRAVFTILDVPTIYNEWLVAIRLGEKLGAACPQAFRNWVETGRAKPLRAEPVKRTRSPSEQLGRTPQQRAVATAVYEYFSGSPIVFEHFAAAVARMMDANIVSLDVTRPSRDGGRDGIGRYRLGQEQNCITVDFALEAKCHAPASGLGVKVLSRLISRLRHRQFGMLVTTSFLAEQAYQELVEDGHPIIVCAGGDIAELLIEKNGIGSANETHEWLGRAFPLGID